MIITHLILTKFEQVEQLKPKTSNCANFKPKLKKGANLNASQCYHRDNLKFLKLLSISFFSLARYSYPRSRRRVVKQQSLHFELVHYLQHLILHRDAYVLAKMTMDNVHKFVLNWSFRTPQHHMQSIRHLKIQRI